MKTVLRLFGLMLMISGWAVAALCLHIVRTPDLSDPQSSKFVIVPKSRLNVNDTYVDARGWTIYDVSKHADLMQRVLWAGKADQFKFLTDGKSKESAQSQLEKQIERGDSTTRTSLIDAGRAFEFAVSY